LEEIAADYLLVPNATIKGERPHLPEREEEIKVLKKEKLLLRKGGVR